MQKIKKKGMHKECRVTVQGRSKKYDVTQRKHADRSSAEKMWKKLRAQRKGSLDLLFVSVYQHFPFVPLAAHLVSSWKRKNKRMKWNKIRTCGDRMQTHINYSAVLAGAATNGGNTAKRADIRGSAIHRTAGVYNSIIRCTKGAAVKTREIGWS